MKRNISARMFFTILLSFFMVNSVIAGGSLFKNFITAKGDQIYDGEKLFRFISFNIPNLLLVEDNMPFTEKNAWRLPDAFEIHDALQTVRQSGGTVARTYVITVQRKGDDADIPKHVLAPGSFNEEAFRVLDQVLATANETGVRLLIPFVDNWKWMGGKPQYESFRDKGENEFWTDETIKNDFKKTLNYVLNRVNTITGVTYKDDKAILAWELGNEIRGATEEWISEMARYVKSIDANHLVNDGKQHSAIDDFLLDNPYVDILSSHHYESNPLEMLQHVRENAEKTKGKKPYYVGEFGFVSTSGLQSISEYVLQNEYVAGALIWSLRFHNRDGGFYWHSEPMGSGLYKAYHFPGFSSGIKYDEQNVMRLMCAYGYKIQNKDVPAASIPVAPRLLPVKDPAHISWQGSVGADYYILERAESEKGPWKNVSRFLSDANTAYTPLFNDADAELNKNYFYRLKAVNMAGFSEPSNTEGPVQKTHYTLVDEMENTGLAYHVSRGASIETGNDRSFKEDLHRLAGEKGAEVIYQTADPMQSILINAFTKEDTQLFDLQVSQDGKSFEDIKSSEKNYFSGEIDYQYWQPIQTKAELTSAQFSFLKIIFREPGQIARVEISYGK